MTVAVVSSSSPMINSPEKKQDILTSGKQVLHQEAAALSALAESIDEAFVKAIEILLSCQGRIVVTGMGKSGHIARKISATLASTGSPALFVHPAEAGHGDLGMITPRDVVIALSFSGETQEIQHIISFTRRFGIPLISLSRSDSSTLSRLADVALVLPPVEEACPMGLAPTTSTTMMLALGDAMAVSLLSAKGFSAQDFKNFHPSGSLGQALSRVHEKMHTGDRLPLVSPDLVLSEALFVMTSKGFGCVGVVDSDGFLMGIITDGDLRRHLSATLLTQFVRDIMTPSPLTIPSSCLMVEALRILNEKERTVLFVVDSEKQSDKSMGKPIGIIHIHDFLRAGFA